MCLVTEKMWFLENEGRRKVVRVLGKTTCLVMFIFFCEFVYFLRHYKCVWLLIKCGFWKTKEGRRRRVVKVLGF